MTSNIAFGVSLLSNPTIYVGGAATITSVASVLSTDTVDVVGGSLTYSNSLVAGALSGLIVNLSQGGSYSNGAGLISALNNTTLNFGTGGGTFIANAGGSVLNLSSLTINGFTNGTDNIEFQNLPSAIGSYSVSQSAGGQTITLFGPTGTQIGSVAVAGTTLPDGTTLAGQSGPLTVTEGGGNRTLSATPGIAPCFLGETLIATPHGEKRVDELAIGDLVLTDNGDAVPVRWIGRRVVSPRFADPMRTMPVRIRAGALGDNLPARDLLISPDHAVLIDDTLVNAGALVNGVTIVQEPMSESFVYYHVEVDEHDLILAEGVSAETFIDHVERMAFDNWAEHAELFGDAPAKPEMAYPRVKSARQLPQPIRTRLEALLPGRRAAA